MAQPELSFTLTPDELDRVLQYGLEFIGMGVLANAVMTLDFDNLSVYANHNSDSISFTYTKKPKPVADVHGFLAS